ncbi:unnamed protein product, partial [Ectocarpus sp. 12 AP-2014]
PTRGLAVLPLQTPAPRTPAVTPQKPAPQQTAQPVTPTAPSAPQPEATEPVTTAALAPLPDPVAPDAEPDSTAPRVSRKPPNRPDSIKPPEPKQVDPKPKVAAAPQGNNATENTRKGSATGSSQGAAARQATTSSKSSEAGNAAMSNYQGKVFRKIARAKRGKLNVRGSATVILTIAPSGQLTGLSLARSSGSGKLDDFALLQIRRAAPFPPSPNGKSVSYTVKVKG